MLTAASFATRALVATCLFVAACAQSAREPGGFAASGASGSPAEGGTVATPPDNHGASGAGAVESDAGALDADGSLPVGSGISTPITRKMLIESSDSTLVAEEPNRSQSRQGPSSGLRGADRGNGD